MGIRRTLYHFVPLAPLLALGACGGGGSVNSASSSGTTTTLPVPTVNYDTAEYRASVGPTTHGAITAYNAGYSGTGITVGIIDSGIASANAEFTNRISPASTAFNGSGTFEDATGHGTAVATVLAGGRNSANTLGMAWGATIMALRTDIIGDCNLSSCSHSTAAITNAIDYARQNGVRVINLSLGGDTAPAPLLAAVERATAAGVIIVVAAGNDGTAGPNGFAASLADQNVSHGLVLVAASVSGTGVHSSFSNGALGYEATTLSAVGENISAQNHLGVYATYGGTSFSTPQIAGAVALMQQAFPNLTSAQIVARLLSTATDAGATSADAVYGSGILNLTKAFAPAGQTSLASTAVAVSTLSNGTASSAMGDLTAASASRAIVIDGLGRAYALDIRRTLSPAARAAILGRDFGRAPQSVAVSGDRYALSLRLAPRTTIIDRHGQANILTNSDMATSGHIITRTGALRIAAGLRETGVSLAQTVAGADSGYGYLAAHMPGQSLGFVGRPVQAYAMALPLGGGLRLSGYGEGGSVVNDADAFTRKASRTGRYTLTGGALDWQRGVLDLHAGASQLVESTTVLGARLADWIGVTGGQTTFADVGADIRTAQGWYARGAGRMGWTHARSVAMSSTAWALEVGKSGIATRQDQLGLRLAQPLRITQGGARLLLPSHYDYATGATQWDRQLVAFSPRGRELDAEMLYQGRVGAGMLTLNGFWRRQPGNIVWMPAEWGGAVQWRIGY